MFRPTSVALLTVVLAACSSTPPAPAPAPAAAAPVATPAAVAPAPAADPKPAPQSTVTPVLLPAHLDPASAISRERSVYFDFDQYVIRDQDRKVVESHAKYLAGAKQLKVAVEGNADERGGREYNLALGQKRAQAVTQSLKLLGVADEQMEAISYGKERPKATGHDEDAWAQNRRADIRYK